MRRETDEEIVASAWDFAEINRLHADHSAILNRRTCGQLLSESDRKAFHQWAGEERMGWLAATSKDPLLPESLLPKDYLGRKAWQLRKKTLGQASEQLRSFRNGSPPEK